MVVLSHEAPSLAFTVFTFRRTLTRITLLTRRARRPFILTCRRHSVLRHARTKILCGPICLLPTSLVSRCAHTIHSRILHLWYPLRCSCSVILLRSSVSNRRSLLLTPSSDLIARYSPCCPILPMRTFILRRVVLTMTAQFTGRETCPFITRTCPSRYPFTSTLTCRDSPRFESICLILR